VWPSPPPCPLVICPARCPKIAWDMLLWYSL
jgi:hypothetical protein